MLYGITLDEKAAQKLYLLWIISCRIFKRFSGELGADFCSFFSNSWINDDLKSIIF